MDTSGRQNQANWRVYIFVSIYLAIRFLWGVFVPGGEYPMPPWHYVSMGVDLVLLICVLMLRSRLFPELGANDPRTTWANVLFGVGLVSGIGLLAIRFTSNAAWWTGHLRSGI